MNTGDEFREWIYMICFKCFFWGGLPLWAMRRRSKKERDVNLQSCLSKTKKKQTAADDLSKINSWTPGSNIKQSKAKQQKPRRFITFQYQAVEVRRRAPGKLRPASAAWSCLICQMRLVAMKREREKKPQKTASHSEWWMLLRVFFFFSFFNGEQRMWMWRREKHFGGWLLTNERSLRFGVLFFFLLSERETNNLPFNCMRACARVFAWQPHCSQVRL